MSIGDLSVGTIVAGRYTVHALLGKRHGRATYHAITAPNRHVALKLLDPELAGTDAEKALAQAATVAAELPEGAVLHVIDRGIDPESGAPFYVSSLSDHPSLDAFVALCPLSLQEMATMARSLARGLDAAHRRGLAHLALRPTNVFVGPPPVCWTRVGDFGAGAIDRALVEGSDRDTLAFAAPELYAGAPASLSPDAAARADVFSAALLCFYAAAGDTYWKATRRRGGAAPGSDVASLAREAVGLRAPASVAAREIGAAWDPKLDTAFARALSKDPRARYASVGEFGDALAEALDLPRFGSAMALTDRLVRGEGGPQAPNDEDDDDGPATRLVATPTAAATARSLAPALATEGSVAPPPDSIAPLSARRPGRGGGLGGTMIMEASGPGRSTAPRAAEPPRTGAPMDLGGTLLLESSAPGPNTAPSAGLVSAVPPPAGVPNFGGDQGLFAPPPQPQPEAGAAADAPVRAHPTAEASTRQRLALFAAGGVGLLALVAIGGFALLGGGPATPAASASAPASPGTSASVRSPPPPRSATASTGEPDAPPTAAPEVTPPTEASGPAEPKGPIPTTYGQQPKPRVDALDPPTTWYAELVVLCEPTCDLVLVQGGPEPNPGQPKQLTPGTYIITVKQSGGVQSQQALLRAATRTTLTFDGRLALPERVPGSGKAPCGGFLKPCP